MADGDVWTPDCAEVTRREGRIAISLYSRSRARDEELFADLVQSLIEEAAIVKGMAVAARRFEVVASSEVKGAREQRESAASGQV